MTDSPVLDIRSLEQATERLAEGIDRYQADISDTQIRDGLIQRFEFTYEISHRMLKQYLSMTSASPEDYDAMPFQDLIRNGNQAGLLRSDWPQWRLYREMRGKTSHTYDENIALEVVREIPSFLHEAEFLREQLRRRIQQ